MANNVERCGTMALHDHLMRTDPAYAEARSRSEEHHWRVRHGEARAARNGVTVIPVVVHVVWKTDSQNISDQQIRSQIEVLNRDFRKANADLEKIPGPFAPLAGDARIEFELATLDPSGGPTTGITRTRTTVDVFEVPDFVNDPDPVKSAGMGKEPWPRDRYLNIWVCQLGTGTTGTMGYSTLPGAPAELDGVVIRHNAFGTTGTAAIPFPPNAANLGRTATHEIGHWLNLHHIWGPAEGCNIDDFVDDTPTQDGPHSGGGPAFPHISCNNGPHGDMFMNYMDNTDDDSKFLFTHGQVERMQACLATDRPTIGFYRPPAWNGPGDLTTVNNIVSVAGHFSTGDQRHLVVVGAAHGKVHDIFWQPAQQGIEGEEDLPVDFGAGTIISVAALYNSDQQRHVVLVGKTDGQVHEIFWKADTVGIEGHDDLPVTFAPGSIVAVSGLYNNSDQRHVVVVGTSAGKLHEIFWKSDTVGIEGHDDFPVSFDSGSIVAVSGFYDSNTQRHVVAVGTKDGKVHQVYWKVDTVGIEAHSMVTQFSANSIVSLAGFYSASDQIEHIVVGLANGRLCELWVKPDLTA